MPNELKLDFILLEFPPFTMKLRMHNGYDLLTLLIYS